MNPSARPPLPSPAHLSEAARRFLAQPPAQAPALPQRDDTDGWLRLVEQTNGYIRTWLEDHALPSPVAVQDTQVAGVHAYVLRAEGDPATDEGPIYVDIHGGAFLYGGGDLCARTGSDVALSTGMTTWSVDYRMPPRHPYPAALDDCLAVYRALLEVRDPADVFVGGSSSGGNLAAALLVRAKDEGLPMPAALVLRTPEADLTESGDSFRTIAGIDNVLSSLREVNELYADGHDLSHPYLSPLFADPSGFPPTFLQSGTRDCSCPTLSACTASCCRPTSRPSCTSSRQCHTAASAAPAPRTSTSPLRSVASSTGNAAGTEPSSRPALRPIL